LVSRALEDGEKDITRILGGPQFGLGGPKHGPPYVPPRYAEPIVPTLTIDDFEASLKSSAPPAGISALVLALWHDGRGDWDAAHRVAQDVETDDGAWVHAYLHRKEGDAGNAAYWYRRAQRPIARGPLEDEWRDIATALLGE